MSRFLSTIAVVLGSFWLSGCAAPAWSTLPAVSAVSSVPAGPATSPAHDPSDPQKMQEVMDELRLLGTLDPAAQDRLMEDLRESDPSLWPLVVQQFRATAAYRRKVMEQTRVKGDSPIFADTKIGTVPLSPAAQAERLPPVYDVAAAPGDTPQQRYPSTEMLPPEAERPAGRPSSQVVQASYTAPAASDWRQRLAGTIEALEAEAPKNPATPAEVAEHARLRMLYAAAGRREDAARPIPGAPPAEQEFLAKELDGLTTWLNMEQNPDATRRAAEAEPALKQAMKKLAESAPLVVCNLAFCTEVQSYGCAKRFEKYEFQPNQEVLLYAEVENFASEPTPKGYFTQLKSRYQIVDAQGRRVAEFAFASTEEYCQNLRRDFFIGYHLHLPKRLDPGKYALQLSIEDLKCQKTGQASIEFEIKDKKEPRMNTDKHG